MTSVLALFSAALLLLVPFFLLQQPAFAQANNGGPAMMTMESTSDQRTFLVKMEWTPAALGSANAFKVHFVEPETGKELEDITYDFIVISEGGQEAVHRHSQAAASTQAVSFSAEGPYTIRIANIDGLGEGADFHVRVTPELFAPALIAAAGIALATFFGAKFRKEL
jgi:hypothetical protein